MEKSLARPGRFRQLARIPAKRTYAAPPARVRSVRGTPASGGRPSAIAGSGKAHRILAEKRIAERLNFVKEYAAHQDLNSSLRLPRREVSICWKSRANHTCG